MQFSELDVDRNPCLQVPEGHHLCEEGRTHGLPTSRGTEPRRKATAGLGRRQLGLWGLQVLALEGPITGVGVQQKGPEIYAQGQSRFKQFSRGAKELS